MKKEITEREMAEHMRTHGSRVVKFWCADRYEWQGGSWKFAKMVKTCPTCVIVEWGDRTKRVKYSDIDDYYMG